MLHDEEPEVLTPGAEGLLKYLKPMDDREVAAADLKEKTDLSDSEIAVKVGLPDAKAVQKALALPQMKGYMADHLDQAGATLAAAAKVIGEAQHAMENRVVSYLGSGSVIEVGPDHKTRLEAAKLNLQIRGELKGDAANINLFADISDQDLAKIATGQLDPATLIDVGPRIENPAGPPPP